jgi:hypothetical protein
MQETRNRKQELKNIFSLFLFLASGFLPLASHKLKVLDEVHPTLLPTG